MAVYEDNTGLKLVGNDFGPAFSYMYSNKTEMNTQLHINKTVEPENRPDFNDWFRHIKHELSKIKLRNSLN